MLQRSPTRWPLLRITQQPGKNVTESVAAALEWQSPIVGVWITRVYRPDAIADLIEAILAQSAAVGLATSREGTRVAHEQVCRSSVRHWGGIDSAAVRLFAERANNVAPQFSLRTRTRRLRC